MSTPFQQAERYIELKKQCAPDSWADTALLVNQLVFEPLIIFTMMFMGEKDLFMYVSGFMNIYKSWSQWIEYNDLRFNVQRMYLTTMKEGGPFIVTNDPLYLPYVFADAVVRTSQKALPPLPLPTST